MVVLVLLVLALVIVIVTVTKIAILTTDSQHFLKHVVIAATNPETRRRINAFYHRSEDSNKNHSRAVPACAAAHGDAVDDVTIIT